MIVRSVALSFVDKPTSTVSVKACFGFDSDWDVPVFENVSEHVPQVDDRYVFNRSTTMAILAGFKHNKRVMLQGYHGTGKSSHIEQVASRLKWPCFRINLDGHLTRADLVGRDTIVVEDGKQVTQFQEGIIPWALRQPIALVFDEYDAARPELMFVIQRLLEHEGRFVSLDKRQVIEAHPYFRLFATTNTVGLGDQSGMYFGIQQMNQANMDRWHIVSTLNYLSSELEQNIVLSKFPHWSAPEKVTQLASMIELVNMTRKGRMQGDLSGMMSLRTLICWVENIDIFGRVDLAFMLSFYNKCLEQERSILKEYFQRCFGEELIDDE